MKIKLVFQILRSYSFFLIIRSFQSLNLLTFISSACFITTRVRTWFASSSTIRSRTCWLSLCSFSSPSICFYFLGSRILQQRTNLLIIFVNYIYSSSSISYLTFFLIPFITFAILILRGTKNKTIVWSDFGIYHKNRILFQLWNTTSQICGIRLYF